MFSHRSMRVRVAMLCVTAGIAWSAPIDAQIAARNDTTTKHGKPLFTVDDALLGLGFTGITVAMFPVDKSLARRLRSPSSSENKFIGRATRGFEITANPGGLVVGSRRASSCAIFRGAWRAAAAARRL